MTVLAHVGHWYHSLLYAAPIVLIALALWWSGRRDGKDRRRKGSAGEGSDRPKPQEPPGS
ncbi:MAG: hypothetical protein ACKOH7_01595 [Solirubrobacterales bacterium]